MPIGAALTGTATTPPTDVTATKVAAMMGKDSPLMRQAKAQGTAVANRRGMTNSSIGIGSAMSSMIGAAVPIASQDSQQEHNRDINSANLAAQERERLLAAQTANSGSYMDNLTGTLSNHEIPATARSAVQASLLANRTAMEDYMQRLYGVNLGVGTN
jgi:hypothetical protein